MRTVGQGGDVPVLAADGGQLLLCVQSPLLPFGVLLGSTLTCRAGADVFRPVDTTLAHRLVVVPPAISSFPCHCLAPQMNSCRNLHQAASARPSADASSGSGWLARGSGMFAHGSL